MDKLPPIKVLLVGADPVHLHLARQILCLAGDMEVLTALDGLEGLEAALSDRPDVIVLSMVLPVMSGPELLRRYRAEGGEAKVLAMSPSSRHSVSRIAFAAGADLVLVEPAQWGETLQAIRFLAGGLARPCRELLDRMGAPAKWTGAEQAAFCAGALGENRCKLLKSAYAEAAVRFDTGADCVEINIRRVIKKVHRLKSPAYLSLPGLTFGEAPPSNREFLLALAQAAKIPL